MKKRTGIYKRGNIYWVTYMWQGRQHFESVHSSRVCDAERRLKELKRQQKKGSVAKPMPSEAWTVDQLLNSYIAQIENPATRKRYQLSQAVLSPHFGERHIKEIDAFDFDYFKEFRRRNGVSPAGVNRDIAVYRAAFNFAVDRRLLVQSPLNGVKLFNEEKHRKPPRVLSFAEERKLLMCCDLRLHTIVVTLIDTGMRVGIEGLRLKWADVDFDESEITITQSKTAAGLRVLPMTTRVKSELQSWHNATNQVSEYVFFNPQRPDTHLRSVKTAWHHALKTAGIPRLPIYQCRHTFSTRLAAAGVADTIIDQLLGHSRRGVLRFYTARVPEYLQDAIRLLDEFRRAKTDLLRIRTVDKIEDLDSKALTLIN